MADYYPLLARAIEQQPTKGREARAAIYARARKALLAQLRGANPPMDEADIARQQDFLEVAIRRLEADHGGRDEVSDPASATSGMPAEPPAPPAPAPELPAAAPPKPAEPPVPQAPSVVAKAPRPRAREEEAEADDLWSRTERPSGLDEGLAGDGVDTGNTGESGAPRRGRARLILGAAAVLLLLAIGAGAFFERDRLVALVQGGGSSASTPAATSSAPGTSPAAEAASKSTDRIAQAPVTATAQQPAPAQPAVQAAPRALMLEEAAGGGQQGLQQFVGKVEWSTETFQPGTGQPQDVGIRALIDIPDRNFKATMTIRRNPDPNIPASHIVDIQFQLPPDFDYGNVASVPGLQAMVSEGAQGAPLRGLAVRVAPGYFLVGLLSGEREQQYNLGLLFNRAFLNVPLVFDNGRRAILVVEKGEAGEQAFRTAFGTWGLLRQQQQPSGN